jgi:translocation and assembly module TamB
VSLHVDGAPEAPLFTGKAVLNGIDFAPAGGGTLVEGLTGTLVFTPGKVSTSGMTLRYDGNVELSGTVGLAGTSLDGVRINAHLDGMKSQPFQGFRTTLTGDLVVLGDTVVRSVRGDLTMVSGRYDQDVILGLSTLLGRFGPGSAGLAPASSPFDAVGLEVRIAIAPAAIEIRNNVARLRADGNLVVRGTWGRPLLFGQVEAEDGGRLTLRGQKYDLLGAKLLFSNPTRIDPFFEVEARTDIKDYRVTVALSGTMSRMTPRFSCDPPLSEAQIISLLTTGDVPTSASSGAPVSSPVSTEASIAQATRELLTGLATDAAASRTKDFLKLDRLQIDPIFIGSTFDAPRLTVGKNLSPDLSVTYSYKASTNQEQVIQVEYQVSRDAFLQFVRDENGVYSVDLRIRQRLR